MTWRLGGFRLAILLLLGIFLPLVIHSAEKTSPQIGVRNAHAMVYDSSRGRVLLFGGADESQVRGDLWQWDAKTWSSLAAEGPSPRTFPAMTYDSFRQTIILFGGNRVLFGNDNKQNTYLNDLWEMHESKWTQINAPGPSARAEAAITFDPNRRRVVLFGGYNMNNGSKDRLGDTWEWDGKNWAKINVEGPSPRNGAAMVYDSLGRESVLFGGSTKDGVSGETWEWDGKSWTENRGAKIEGRFNPAMAYDAERGKIIRFGGRFNGKPFGDTWEYDGKSWKKRTSIGPTPRNHTAMVYDSQRKRIILFGGHDFGLHGDTTKILGDTWEWDGNRWFLKRSAQAKNRIENNH